MTHVNAEGLGESAGDVPPANYNLPCQLPFHFLGMPAWKVANSNRVVMGCLANGCKRKQSDHNNVTPQLLGCTPKTSYICHVVP